MRLRTGLCRWIAAFVAVMIAFGLLSAAAQAPHVRAEEGWSVETAVKNPGFEIQSGSGIAWQWVYGFDFNSVTGDDYIRSGNSSLRFAAPVGESATLTLTQDIRLIENDTSVYTLSGWITGVNISYAAISVSRKGETDWLAGEVYTPAGDWESWKSINTGSFTITEDGDYTLTVTLSLQNDGKGYLDDFSLSETVDMATIDEARETLKARIAEAKAIDTGDYTDESVTLLKEAIASADAVAADESARLRALHAALEELNAAIAALEPIPAEQLTQARDRLNSLIAIAESHAAHPDYYTPESFAPLLPALTDAKTLAADPDAQLTPLIEAADTLSLAIDSLQTVTTQAPIHVDKVPGTMDSDGFARGVDLSSYQAVKDGGARFYDEAGEELSDSAFFRLLKNAGINYVRLRVWNDPYDESGNGYGGGNCDLDKAVRLGKFATGAGMRVMISFQYSDFWADADRQIAPKAWQPYIDIYGASSETAAGLIADEVYSWTRTSLQRLLDAGVDVGMVQIGNETNHAIAGITGTDGTLRVLGAGVSAVRDVAAERSITLASSLHFSCTDQTTLLDLAESCSGIPYDIFSVSYTPYRDGTIASLNSKLGTIAQKYDRQVMVAQTGYVHTWHDGDGQENAAPGGIGQQFDYPVSVQGQAQAVRDVVDAVASVTTGVTGTAHGRGVGVFYWEPAWIPVRYAYRSDGSLDETVYAGNRAAWETYGCGYAASFARSYDPSLTEKRIGGSNVDNQGFFDFYGRPLPSLYIYRYLQTGSEETPDIEDRHVTDVTIADNVTQSYALRNGVLTMNLGTSLDLSEIPAEITWSDATATTAPIRWDPDDELTLAQKIRTTGTWSITGEVTADHIVYTLTLTVVVNNPNNQIVNGTFETAQEMSATSAPWRIDVLKAPQGKGAEIRPNGEKAHTGNGALWFGDDQAFSLDVTQVVAPSAGVYTLSAWIQGAAGTNSNIYLWAQAGSSPIVKSPVNLSGYGGWQHPVIESISLSEGQILTVGIHLEGDADLSGTVDDIRLLGTYAVRTVSDPKKGSVSLSTAKALYGEEVSALLLPASGYRIGRLTLNGMEQPVVNNRLSFRMPAENVVLEAFWEALPAKIPLSDCDVRLEHTAMKYIGRALEPAVIATYADGAVTLKKDTDYTVTYSNNINAGQNLAKAHIKGKGRYTGSLTLSFTIVVATPLSRARITEIPNQEYTGFPVCPVPIVTIKVNGVNRQLSQKNGDFSVLYENNRAVGMAKLTIIGSGELYNGSKTVTFRIIRRNLKKHLDVSGDTMKSIIPASVSYTGAPIIPPVVIRDGNYTLQKGKDYRITCQNNKNASKDDSDALMIITGIGNYSGKVIRSFAITPKSVMDTDVRIDVGAVTAGGLNVKYPSIRLTVGGRVFPARGHYEIYRDPETTTAAGEKRLKIRGVGNLCDETDWIPYFTTTKDNQLANMRVSGNTKQTYRCGERVTLPELTFTNRNHVAFTEFYTDPKTGETTQNFSVEYENNVNTGTAIARVTGLTGQCAGYREVKFRIVPLKISARLLPNMEASLLPDPVFGDTLYATGYALKPDFEVRYTCTETDRTGKATSRTVSLTPEVHYRVVLRKNVRPGTAVAVLKGIGNYRFSKKVRFLINRLNASDLTVEVGSATYTGKRVKPSISFSWQGKPIELKEGVAYSANCKRNRQAASAADGKNAPVVRFRPLLWSGSRQEIPFTIFPAQIHEEDITVRPVKYKGKSISPVITVRLNNKRLKAGRDYVASLQIPTDAYSVFGLQQVTVNGTGNYCGTVTKTVIVR